jgi:hypothetical protein
MFLFDTEYWDSLWHEDKVPGVSFLFPECDRKKLGVLMLSYDFEDSPTPRSVLQPDPEVVRQNVNKIWPDLDLPLQFGDGPAKFKALAAGKKITTRRIRESKATQISFQVGAPVPFRLLAMFSQGEGLCELEIARLDLVRANKRS